MQETRTETLTLRSPAFREGERIPVQHACPHQGGKDLSPALSWTGLPAGTRALALVMEDPDAASGTWTHWIWWDMRPQTEGIGAGADVSKAGGAFVGQNSWNEDNLRYRGPCPPAGTGEHRYAWRLYALDGLLGLPDGATRAQMEGAMDGHVLAVAQLVGSFAPPE